MEEGIKRMGNLRPKSLQYKRLNDQNIPANDKTFSSQKNFKKNQTENTPVNESNNAEKENSTIHQFV